MPSEPIVIRKSTTLLLEYRRLRDEGASWMQRRDAYNAYFRQACKEGRPPDALRVDSPDEIERFWAHVIPGPEAHLYWTGPQKFRMNNGSAVMPHRWVWQHTHGGIDQYTEIVIECDEKKCVNLLHLRHRPREERRQQMTREQMIGGIQVLSMRLGGLVPRLRDWNESGLFRIKADSVASRFGSWEAAVEAAGITGKKMYRTNTTPEECFNAIRALAEHLGHSPTRGEWNTHSEWLLANGYPSSAWTITRRTGLTYTEARKKVLG